MAYLFLIILVIVLLWPFLRPYLMRFMSHRAEDMVRRRMGMPSRKEEEKLRKQSQEKRSSRQSGRYSAQSGPIIPHEYAEDVDYTEIRDYSQTDVNVTDNSTQTHTSRHRSFFRHTSHSVESQVEDAEFTEIRDK